jgi:hypothetical protein
LPHWRTSLSPVDGVHVAAGAVKPDAAGWRAVKV